MMDPHDIEMGVGPFSSDAPPSPLSADTTSSGATNPDVMRTASGKKLDRRLWVFVMVAVFTLALLVFSMVMLCLGRSESVWLPVMTFSVGVWTGQLPSMPSAVPKSPSNPPTP